ncbi:YcaO-like family protein [Streptosporangium sp. NPDC000396]|uniref:YcaO-like family protein n=1 Tax=Streptosporangium sp. NPDC000396 TaxID=3366185 RepID=UPI0036885D59
MTIRRQPRPTPRIVTRAGTYRTATPEQTRARIEPMLGRFGITRIADVTRLDEIGLPVHIAYRPCGRTLAASIGIALQPSQSWVSAAMESIETWHAENPRLKIVERGPARTLRLPYDVRSLNLAERSPLSESTTLDWVLGHGILSGRPIPVPLGLIHLDSTRRPDWNMALFNITSNGMATGNTYPEAVLHALLEVIERDCCAPVADLPTAERVHADPAGTTHPTAVTVLAALRAAGCHVELCQTTNQLGIPAYACAIWSPDVPIFFSGFGCHLDPGLAAARAMIEAALSRLAGISGARDDIDELFYLNADPLADPQPPTGRLRRVGAPVGPDDSIESVIRFCAERIHSITGVEPIAVDMTRADIGIPATKVIAPGLRMFDDASLSQREGATHG